MRKYILFLLIFVMLFNISVFCETTGEKRMIHKEGIIYFFKTSGINPTKDEYLAYAKDYYQDTYKKYYDDEFEWKDQFDKIKAELNDSIKNYQEVNYIGLTP